MPSFVSHRRYISEVRFGAERPAVTLFGNRTVYDHWPQIEPRCGQLLLTPQWRAAQGRVSFTWQQPGADAPLSRDELQELRSVIASLAADLPTQVPEAAHAVSGLSADRIQQVALAKAGEIIRRLAAKPDLELANFACRTPAGPRLHSWGADAAAHPLLLETPKQDIHGQLIIEGGERLTGEVLLQTTRGVTLERARPDASGHFTFTGVAQGLYRVRPVYSDVFFASPDVSVTVKRDEPTTVELRGTWRKAPSAAQLAAELKLQQERKRRRRYLLLALLLLLLLGTTGRTVWLNWQGSSRIRPPTETVIAVRAPEVIAAPPTTAPVAQQPPIAKDTAPSATPSSSATPANNTGTGAGAANTTTPTSPANSQAIGSTASAEPAPTKNAAASAPFTSGPAASPTGNASASTAASAPAPGNPATPPSGASSPDSVSSTPTTTPAVTPPPANSAGSDSSPVNSSPPASGQSDSPASLNAAPTSESPATPTTREESRVTPEKPPGSPAVTPPAANPSADSSATRDAVADRATAASNRPATTVTLVVPNAAPASAPAETKSGSALPGNKPAATKQNPSSPIGTPPPAVRTTGNSPLAPDTPADRAGAQNTFPIAPPPSSPSRSSNTPVNAAPAIGTGQLPENSSPTSAAQFTPLLPGTSAGPGKGNFIPVADGAGGPGKATSPASPSNSASRPLAQTQIPGGGSSGGRATPQGTPGSGGGAASGAVIGGISVLGGANVGGPQTVGESEDGTHATNGTNGTNTPANAAGAVAGTRPLDAFEARPEAALHLNMADRRESASDFNSPSAPNLGPMDQPTPADARPSSFINSSVIHLPAQPNSVLLQLRWELRQEENLIAPELSAVRQQLLASNQLKLPKTLRDPQTEGGIIIELPKGVEVRPPVWRDLVSTSAHAATDRTGLRPELVSVVGNRAEFSWRGNQLPKGADYVLESTEGQLWAKVSVDKNGLATVSVAPGAIRSYWVGVLRSPEDNPLLTPSDWTKRLQWRTSEGKPLAREWKRDDTWRNGHGYRLEIPLDETNPSDISPRGIGLVDALTGWVLINPFMVPSPAR